VAIACGKHLDPRRPPEHAYPPFGATPPFLSCRAPNNDRRPRPAMPCRAMFELHGAMAESDLGSQTRRNLATRDASKSSGPLLSRPITCIARRCVCAESGQSAATPSRSVMCEATVPKSPCVNRPGACSQDDGAPSVRGQTKPKLHFDLLSIARDWAPPKIGARFQIASGRNRPAGCRPGLTPMAINSEDEWAERAAAFLKHKLKECEVTYAELATRPKRHEQGNRSIDYQ
jgi:hypothetical protein